MKKFDEKGFVFFTNYNSKKSCQIIENPCVAILFNWESLDRQVNVIGLAKKIDKKESLEYFLSRPRGSQLGAWVSDQSAVISSRKLLEDKLEEIKVKFDKEKVTLPNFWGGYRIKPESFEFWQGRPDRLHDRFLYSQNGDNWKIERLSP